MAGILLLTVHTRFVDAHAGNNIAFIVVFETLLSVGNFLVVEAITR